MIGTRLNVVLLAVVGVTILGVAGVTVYYEYSVGDVTDRADRLAQQKATAEEELATVRAELNRTRERLGRINESLETRRTDLQDLTGQLEAAERNLSDARDRIDRLEDERQELQREVDDLLNERADLRDRVAEPPGPDGRAEQYHRRQGRPDRRPGIGQGDPPERSGRPLWQDRQQFAVSGV
jgi:septal ring factor EnvC (AmiA/AmiB activator)